MQHYTVTIPARPPEYINFFKPFQTWPVNHQVVPIGVSHISLRHKKYNQGSGRKRTKNKRTIWAWVNSSSRRLSCDTLHSWCICRLTLACISSKISSRHEECWLILTGLPSLNLDPISCRLVSAAVRCRLPTATLRPPRQLFLWLLSSDSCLVFPCLFPVASRSRAQAFVWVRAKTDKGIVCLADHPHSVTIQ